MDAADHIGKYTASRAEQVTSSVSPKPDTLLAEETHNAPKILPIAIGTSALLNEALGFAMLIALFFTLPDDIQGTLESVTFYPVISIYTYATGLTQGGTALVRHSQQLIEQHSASNLDMLTLKLQTAIMICTQVFGAIGVMATASRMIW